jgi:hypothetical protein
MASNMIQRYLGSVEQDLRIDPAKRREVLDEVRTDLEEHSAELQNQGFSDEEASAQVVLEGGNPRKLAKTLYSVHATGSWRDILLSVVPHLALAAIFAFHLWTDLFWVVVATSSATLIAVLAWRRGNPQWTYPWLGYALAVPALTWALATAAIGYGAWRWVVGHDLPLGIPLYLGIALYVPISLVLILRVARRAVRHDWLLVSLAALPIPFFTAWLFLLHWHGGVLIPDKARALATDSESATLFLALAATTALYMKMGHRSLRMFLVLLGAPTLVGLALVTYQLEARPLAVVIGIPVALVFFLSPLLLDPSGKSIHRFLMSTLQGHNGASLSF